MPAREFGFQSLYIQMGKKLATFEEKLTYVESVLDELKSVDEVVQEAKAGVSTVYKWMKEKQVLEEHVKNGRGSQVRVTVTMHDAGSQKKKGPRPPTPHVQKILEWLASSPTGSVSLDELVHQFSIVPNFPAKTKQAQWVFVRRLVAAHSLGQHVSFTTKCLRKPQAAATATSAASAKPPTTLPNWPLSPVAARKDLLLESDDDFDLFADQESMDGLVEVLRSKYDRSLLDTEYEPDTEVANGDIDGGTFGLLDDDTFDQSIIELDMSDDDNAAPAPGNFTHKLKTVEGAQESYVHITANIYDGDARVALGVTQMGFIGFPRNLAPLKRCPPNAVCDCWSNHPEYGVMQCNGTQCVNYTNLCICPPTCRMGKYCANRGFDGIDAPHELFTTVFKGTGVRTLKDVAKGQIVFEYVGEVIDEEEFDNRFKGMTQAACQNFYFMQIAPKLYVDAYRYGNHSRFVNHSCVPNCVAEVWTKQGSKRIAIRALKDIGRKTELTFDYKWLQQSDIHFTCKCRTGACKGLKKRKFD
jgi:hypothetical protein